MGQAPPRRGHRLSDHPLRTRQEIRRERKADEAYAVREQTRIREIEARDRHPLESWGLSEASAAEMTTVVGRFDHYDETELQIDTDWERMLAEPDANEEMFARFDGVPRVG